MFAVLKTGGKQYRVSEDDVIVIERLAADAGETVQFNDVLMLGGDAPVFGSPLVEGAAVQGEVLDQFRGEKLINFKKRRRKHSSKRRKGHRQNLTSVRVTRILAEGAGETGVKLAIGTGGSDSAPIVSATLSEARRRIAEVGTAEAMADAAEEAPLDAEAVEAVADAADLADSAAAEDTAPADTAPADETRDSKES